MRVVLAGGSGLIGAALAEHLRARGDAVRLLVRRPARDASETEWDPAAGELDPGALAGADAVVNLGGAGIGSRRWTAAYRRELLASRTAGTGLIARTLADHPDTPRVLVQASAVGYYGSRGAEVLTESATPGDGFLPSVAQAWEAATEPAVAAGVRVAIARSGIVVAPRGGALARMLPLVRLGIAGRLGSGRQFWSWITLEDEVRALTHLLDSSLAGPVNLAAPEPVTNAEFTRELARAFRRRAPLPVPAWALRIGLGGLAEDVLSSTRAVPEALRADGFAFSHPTLADALDWLRASSAPR